MVVWILTVVLWYPNGGGVTSYTVQDIQSAQSCEQLAKVARTQPSEYIRVNATCAPVRKVQVK